MCNLMIKGTITCLEWMPRISLSPKFRFHLRDFIVGGPEGGGRISALPDILQELDMDRGSVIISKRVKTVTSARVLNCVKLNFPRILAKKFGQLCTK